MLLHDPDRAELQLSWCQGTQPVGHKAPNYLVYISRLSPALQSLYLSLFTRFSPSIFQQILLHVYLGRESQHSLMSCMRMKTCMKMVAVWGYASGPGWYVSCQSLRVRIWEIVHIQAFSPRNRITQVNQEVTKPSKVTNRLLRYGSWGEPCACILWYREERRRKTRDIWMRHQPPQQRPCIRSLTSCTSVTLPPLSALDKIKQMQQELQN